MRFFAQNHPSWSILTSHQYQKRLPPPAQRALKTWPKDCEETFVEGPGPGQWMKMANWWRKTTTIKNDKHTHQVLFFWLAASWPETRSPLTKRTGDAASDTLHPPLLLPKAPPAIPELFGLSLFQHGPILSLRHHWKIPATAPSPVLISEWNNSDWVFELVRASWNKKKSLKHLEIKVLICA